MAARLLMVLGLLVTMMSGSALMASGQTNPSQCKDERKQIENACRPVIFGRNPSQQCCLRVRVTHVECVCPYVTPKLAALIGVDRAIRQIEACGRTVPHNFKCGSVTTP
ncbi:uncharacterized protein LOC116194892 [Punica granatum]|uniref:Uncharacterized protein n=2 Tax=Punica granatum TaxID=22663 RepID=A0A2I0JEB9_PUNGR|nr:uncharacterized protein LOC116194892 [Punica granatum]PKI54569.1 hypothetical protein CRG98_025083 [Punica granatum]